MGVLQSTRRPVWFGFAFGLTLFILCSYILFTSYPNRYALLFRSSLPSNCQDRIKNKARIRNSPGRSQITDIIRTNCHKKIRKGLPDRKHTKDRDTALPSLISELWKPLIHPIEEPVFVTDKGERFEVPSNQMRWKEPLGKRVVIIDTDTRLNETNENTMLNECPLHYPSLPGRTAGHLNHYIYGTECRTFTLRYSANP